MSRKKLQSPDVADVSAADVSPADAAPAVEPVNAATELLSLDDVAMLLVQLEPSDVADLEQVRASLMRIARSTDDFDAAVALGSAATQVAVAAAGGDESVCAAALARANGLLEGAMRRLDHVAPAPASSREPDEAERAGDEEADAFVNDDAAAAELAAAMAEDPAWAEVADELAAEERAAEEARVETSRGPAGPFPAESLPDDIDADLLRDFIAESRDCIALSEAALLDLEHDPDDTESVNTVFRAFHTIKGTSAFMGLGRISEFAHHAESLLSLVRDREIEYEGSVADLSLRAVDMLSEMLTGVEEAIAGAPLVLPGEFGSLIAALEVAATGGAAVATSPAAAPSTSSRATSPARGAPPEHHDALAEPVAQHPSAASVSEDAPAATTGSGGQPFVERRQGGDRRQGDRRQGDRRQGERRQGERRQDAASELSVRVRTDRLDRLIDMVGELVIAQSMIAQDPAVVQKDDTALTAKVTHAGKLVRDLQDLAMSMRMVPLKPTFQKLARLVRDLAHQVGKQVELVTEGEDTEIDRNMVDIIGDPLVHMVRNALDHGLETPAERVAAGKDPVGTIRLRAYHVGGNVVVDLADDGRGLDREKILARARDRGIVARDRSLTDTEILELIFAPGFSTAEQVTDVSGRGVGMDVVKRNVESLRGRVEIASEAGKGSTFSVRLPLTLAITDGMLVRVGAERYIVPTAAIHMSFRPERSMLSTINGRGEVVRLRDEVMPVARVHRLLDVEGAVSDPAEGILMIVGDQERRTALLVDELLGQHQLVVKSLGGNLGQIPGISGAAILGDGRVGLILDLASLVALARSRGDDTVRPAA